MSTESQTLTNLGAAFALRIEALGISRREFARVSGISRQTMHKVEHVEGHSPTDAVLQQIDTALRWVPGTAKGLVEGSHKAVIRWRVIENINSMSLEELESMCAFMEAQALGSNPDELMSTEEALSKVSAKVRDQDSQQGKPPDDDGATAQGHSRPANARKCPPR
jgi:DNA-binding XRE family transcriptional regulator